jgi:hypothetical protein
MRAVIQREEGLSSIFLQYRRESKSVEWLRDLVAPRIMPFIDSQYDFATVVEACQYLADEYHQLGDGYFLVSSETGKVQAVITENDLYDPEKLSRYSGDIVQPLKRLKPNTELALVSYQYEKGREKEILAQLIARNPQTQYLAEVGDERFRMATRAGRKQIVQDLGESNPRALLARSGGTTGRFLQYVDLRDEAPPEDTFDAILEGVLNYRTQINVQDPLTVNYGHNQLGTLKGTVPQAWVRDLCRSLSETAYTQIRAMAVGVDELEEGHLRGVHLWIGDPDVYRILLKLDPKVQAVPVDGVDLIGITGKIGTLVLPSEFQVVSQERFSRWEVLANIPYKFYVNWSSIRVLPLAGIVREGIVDL